MSKTNKKTTKEIKSPTKPIAVKEPATPESKPMGQKIPKVSADNIPKPKDDGENKTEPVIVKKTLRRTKYTFNVYHVSTLGLAFHFSFFEVDPDAVLKKALNILGNNVGFKNLSKYHSKMKSFEVLD